MVIQKFTEQAINKTIESLLKMKDKASLSELKSKLEKLKIALGKEREQTKQMLETYFNYTQGKASDEEMEQANKQFQDFLKTLGLGVFVILPGAPITIPLIVKLGQKLGVDVIPDSFKDN
jgi:Fe-S oxidoreductase